MKIFMARVWIFQANPKMYAVDDAIAESESIWWRVPQYASEVHSGDIAVIWRSGKSAGVIGTGRVLCDPEAHGVGENELKYLIDREESAGIETRVKIAVNSVPFIPKVEVASLPGFADHKIITAPMGTVFALETTLWEHLNLAIAPVQLSIDTDLPKPFAWDQRTKAVMPLPGGYDGYLESAKIICALIEDLHPTPNDLSVKLAEKFHITESAARRREWFLRKIGLSQVEGGVCELSRWARNWLESENDRVITALLHSRCRFIGEMIAELIEPKSADELLAIVNQFYGMEWDTQTQVTNRRGWLQSAGMIKPTGDGRFVATPTGISLLTEISVEERTTRIANESKIDVAVRLVNEIVEHDVRDEISSDALVQEIEDASVASTDPDRFEHAVRDAFEFLGFDAEHLGKSGKTDVLLFAPLGQSDSYRVAVDAKTTGNGVLGDGQVDWKTLEEHRVKHNADFSLLVGPSPSQGRLMERAENSKVVVLSANQLAGLCRQHAKNPQGLEIYRSLFETPGPADTTAIGEAAEEQMRMRELTLAICESLAVLSPRFGRLKARDVWLRLGAEEEWQTSNEAEIQTVFDALASPVLGIVSGSADTGYLMAMPPTVAKTRIEFLANGFNHAQTAQ